MHLERNGNYRTITRPIQLALEESEFGGWRCLAEPNAIQSEPENLARIQWTQCRLERERERETRGIRADTLCQAAIR